MTEHALIEISATVSTFSRETYSSFAKGNYLFSQIRKNDLTQRAGFSMGHYVDNTVTDWGKSSAIVHGTFNAYYTIHFRVLPKVKELRKFKILVWDACHNKI